MTITAFSKPILARLRTEMETDFADAFAKLEAKHGVKCRFASGSFDTTKFTIKLEVSIPGAIDPQVIGLARMIGFDATKPSKNGDMITGYNGRKSKMPWLMTNAAGEQRVCGDRYALMNWPAVEYAPPVEVSNLIAKAG